MRNLAFAFAASMLIAGCSGSSSGAGGAPTGEILSCDWGVGTCEQYGGTIDPNFASVFQTTCTNHGVAFATAACPSANRIAGYCDLGTTNGMTDHYYYYSPAYDAATAKADCESAVVGVVWVP